ncbi:MAG: NHL repeat-containing protein [Acidobacteriaceae bacterium]
MNIEIGCEKVVSTVICLCPYRPKTGKFLMAVLALLALLCGMAAPVCAQTASFSGSTSVFDATDFLGPQGIATDASGNVYIADDATETVYKRTRTGPGVYSAAVALPNPTPGYVYLRGIAIDSNGNLWVADNANGSGGQVYELTTIAGSFGAPAKVGSGWSGPWGIAADASGNVFVTDNSANSISEISSGTVTVVNTGAVSAPRGIAVNSAEELFAVDGNLDKVVGLVSPYTSATAVNTTAFQGPGDIALDASGNIWVAAYSSSLIRELTASSGYATILSWGSGLSGPVAVWPDADGNILVSDYSNGNNGSIAQIDIGAVNVGTVAVNSTSGTQTLAFSFNGSANTTIQAPVVVTRGAAGQDFVDAGTGSCTTTNGVGNPYAPASTCTVNVNLKPKYAGPRYGAVELLNTSGTLLATAFIYGTGSGPELVFPGSTTIQTLGGGFSQPLGVARDGNGNLYIADQASTVVLKVPTGCVTSACVTTMGGGFLNPTGVAVDGIGNVYVADYGNNAVKEMPASCTSSSCVAALGGGFSSPVGVAVDGSGNIYVADNGNNAVKEMPPGCTSASCVTALGAGFGSPTGVAVDGSGNVYVAGSGSVKEMSPGCTSGACVTALGGGFNTPIGLAVDSSGNVYVGDLGTNLVDEMPPGCASFTCVTTRGSGFSSPAGVVLDGSGNLYIDDKGNSAVKELSLTVAPSLSFATTNTGSQSSDSPQAVTLSNIGNAALTFPVPGTGENPSVSASFALDGSTTCPEVTTSSSAGTLAGGASCQLAVDFVPATIGQISGQAVVKDNNQNASPAVTQSIGLSGVGATPIVPYIQVNSGAWTQESSVAVNATDTVNLGPNPASGGSWSWTGPNGFTSTSRILAAVALPLGTNTYTATYTNTASVQSTMAFTITVNPTTIVPYIQVNSGAWTQESGVTVNATDTVNLGPQPTSGGNWSWTGPNGFTSTSRVLTAVALPSGTNTYTATYTNTSGVQSTPQVFTITVNSTPIVPYVEVNGGGWQQVANVSVNLGDTVNLGPQPASGGSWSWTGPNGFTSTSRVLSAIPLAAGTDIYTATYTNTSGGQSTQAFTITVNTPVTPYMQVDGGAWTQESSVTVNQSDTVNLGPQPASGGSWSWSGPNGFASTSRVLYAVPLTAGTDIYTATYTNAAGGQSAETFTITVNTPVTPYMQVDGGAWTQESSATVNVSDTVNLGPQPASGGSWSWTGPNGFTSTSRVLYGVPLTAGTDTYTATYTNTAGGQTTQIFTITVNTPIVPYIQDGGAWTQESSATVNVSDTVNLGPQPANGGSWSWTGPNGFTSSSRVLYGIPLTAGTDTYTATYTNTAGGQTTQTFTITVNTPVVPYIQVDGGAWTQESSASVNSGDTVNLGPQPVSGGSWSWSGPNGFSSSSRVLYAVPLAEGPNTYTATYTNTAGGQTTQTFTITVN